MDILAIREQLERARNIELAVNGATFQLRLPSDQAWRETYENHTGPDGKLLQFAFSRALVDAALTGWAGITARHFRIENDEPVAFSSEARATLLEWRPDLTDGLINEIARVRGERAEKLQAAQKN